MYELALAALAAGGAATAAERCRLLLALGDAQGRRGDDAGAKVTFLDAADVARSAELHELFARAAAGYGGRFLWTHGLTDERLVPLLEEGLAAVGTGDSALRVRLLSRLAAALRHGPTRSRRQRLMGEAIPMARRIGDPSRSRPRSRPPSPRCTHRTPPASAWPTRARSSRSRPRRGTASACSTATSTRSGPPGSSATPIAARASSRR